MCFSNIAARPDASVLAIAALLATALVSIFTISASSVLQVANILIFTVLIPCAAFAFYVYKNMPILLCDDRTSKNTIVQTFLFILIFVPNLGGFAFGYGLLGIFGALLVTTVVAIISVVSIFSWIAQMRKQPLMDTISESTSFELGKHKLLGS
jgi:hypothetical protein